MNSFWELILTLLTSVLGAGLGAYWFSRTYRSPAGSAEGSGEDPASKQ